MGEDPLHVVVIDDRYGIAALALRCAIDARPQVGIDQADVVYEEEVEGGITASTQQGAEAIVARLQEAANTCLAAPETVGCP